MRYRLTTPAILFLESMTPLHFVTSQAMVGSAPLLSLFVSTQHWERFAAALEKRDAVAVMIDAIEEGERDRLSGERADLEGERERLTADVRALTERVARLAAELDRKIAALADAERRQAAADVGSTAHREATRREVLPEHRGELLVVVDDEDTHRWSMEGPFFMRSRSAGGRRCGRQNDAKCRSFCRRATHLDVSMHSSNNTVTNG